MMDRDIDDGCYQRVRLRRAKRLATEVFAQIEAEAREGPTETELACMEEERIAVLIAGRRQREAKLVADFTSDEIYDLEDESGLAMQQALKESRRRVEWLCEGRKVAGCTELVTDDILAELQSFLTSCGIYLGFVSPGRNAADLMGRSGDRSVSVTLPRHDHDSDEIRRSNAGTRQRGTAKKPSESTFGETREWASTSASGMSPTADIVFKCVDTNSAVVVGAAPDEGQTPDADRNEFGTANKALAGAQGLASAGGEGLLDPPSLCAPSHDSRHKEINTEPGSLPAKGRNATRGGLLDDRRTATVAGGRDTSFPTADVDSRRRSSFFDLEQDTGTVTTSAVRCVRGGEFGSLGNKERGPSVDVVRPQVCVPLVGTGDCGCIGVIGVQGFNSGIVIKDDDWRYWVAARLAPLDEDRGSSGRSSSRGVKRLKLVRPRGLPTRGKLENVPSGTAARVVYGAVERISLKRGVQMYAVRWEDGLLQMDISKKYIHEVIAEDDSSVGKGASLTAEVVEHLAWIGKTVGPIVDQVRKAVHLSSLKKVTLAVTARPREVLESALFALVQCLPSLAAAEVWQLDDGGSIRCILSLEAGGGYCRPNRRVDDLLHEQDLPQFCLEMEMEMEPTLTNARDHVSGISTTTRKEEAIQGTNSRPRSPNKGQVIRPKQTHGILATPFRDLCFKVGKSWIGADRLARGFALVLRIADASPTGSAEELERVARPNRFDRSPRQGRPVLPDDEAAIGKTQQHENVEDGKFAATVAGEVEVALACVRGRERRAAIRTLALKRLSLVCSTKTSSGREANHAVLAEISAVLPDCRAYVGILQPGGDSILYEAATPNSNMLRRELRRGEGVSFTSLDSPGETVRVVRHRSPPPRASHVPPRPPSLASTAAVDGPRPPALVPGTDVEAWYASSWLPASVMRARGHGFYDIAYGSFGETEAGVPRWRLRETVVLEHLDVKVFWGTDAERDGRVTDTVESSRELCPWPFVCVPLRCGGNRIGVLGIDGWAGVPLGRKEETHPEQPVISFLKGAGELLAAAHHSERRRRALFALGATVRGKDTTEDGALEALIVLLRETVTFRRRVDILETRAAEPGTVYCRGRWAGVIDSNNDSGGGDSKSMKTPAQVFEVNVSAREDELCITPAQYKLLGTRRAPGPATSKESGVEDSAGKLTPYQQEMHLAARDGPGTASGLYATALESRPEEIVGRFQRLAVRPGGGRPSADGWYLVRVSRTLPEIPVPRLAGATAQRHATNTSLHKGGRGVVTSGDAEEGDITLLSDMCRRLEMGLMAIMSREQRACVRMKALDRVLACCDGFSVGAFTKKTSSRIMSPAIANTRATHGIPEPDPATTLSISTKQPQLGISSIRDKVLKVARVTSERKTAGSMAAAVTAIMEREDLEFSAPIVPPTPAETPDGRKGALVALKDSRLAVLVQQGEKRVAVVELPGGKQQIVGESEVVPGQSVFLQSGQAGVLVETVNGTNAVVVLSSTGKAIVVQETKSGGRTRLPLSALKNIDQVATLAAGEKHQGSNKGLDVIRQVIAAIQWALPQVDVYVGLLAPFAGSLYFTEGSSRFLAAGKRLYRHTKPNGGEAFGVVADGELGDDNSGPVHRDEVQSPSWDVIDTCNTAVVRGSASEASKRLHFFSDPLQQGWPWVAVPIRPGTRSQAVRGVLCVDRFEEPWAEDGEIEQHPESDVRNFLEASAASLGFALDREAKSRALQSLRCVSVGGSSTDSSNDDGNSKAKIAGMDQGLQTSGGRKGVAMKGDEVAVIASAGDVYAALAGALAQALVHCERFEIWEVTQRRDADGRFFLEPSLAGQPPPFQPDDGDPREMLRLDITHCTGLAKADRFGLSDPFCVITWQNVEVGKTPTVYNTVRPVWKACSFELPIGTPTNVSQLFGGKGAKGAVACERTTVGVHGKKEGSGAVAAAIELVVQVWDEDDGEASDFLGELRLGGGSLLGMARAAQKLELPLEAKRDGTLTAEELKLVQGSIGLRVSPATDGALSVLQESEDAKRVFLEVTILESRGLNLGEGGCPYSVINLDGNDIGETPAIPNGLDPVWMETVHVEFTRDRLQRERDTTSNNSKSARASSTVVPPPAFSITVWDRAIGDRGHQGSFVGRVSLSVTELVAYVGEDKQLEGDYCGDPKEDTGQTRNELPLTARNGKQNVGFLVFTIKEAPASKWRAEAARLAVRNPCDDDLLLSPTFDRKVRLTVLRASGLAQADDSGSSDPMCILKRRGREVGRTTTVYACLDPIWGGGDTEGESFLLTIPHPREASKGKGGVVLEVYDEDFGEPSDFLGQVAITGNDLLRFHSAGTFKGPDAESKEALLQKKPDDEVQLTEQWLVQGSLLYRLEGVDKGEEKPTDFVVVDDMRVGLHAGAEGGSLTDSNTNVSVVGKRSQPQTSQYRRMEVRVMEAHGLAKADRFGLSDPYVVIRANAEKQLGRTRTIPLSLEPVWTDPEERFVVSVGLDDAAKCDLALEVWDEDDLGHGDFLGQVTLPKGDLLDLRLPTGPMECELEKNPNEGEEFNNLVQGVLTFSVREAYGDMSDDPAPGGSSVGEVSLTVVSAKGLAKADVFGKSDPFAVVLLNRREIGRTRTLFKTLDPCWADPRETFLLRRAGNKTRGKVVVQLWDEDVGKKGDFLGQASLGWGELDLLPGESRRQFALPLGIREGVLAREQTLVQGSVKVLVEAPLVEAPVVYRAARSYVVTVERAWGLAKANRFGKSDPFISVKVNGDGDTAERGRTRTLTGTGQPVWKNPSETFILTGVNLLVLEAWNANRMNRGEFLGEVRFTKEDLAAHVPVDGTHEFTAAHALKPGATDKFNRLVQGSLRFTCQDWMSPDRLVAEGLGEWRRLTVVSASCLPRDRFGLSSPFACIRWNGLEVGRTRIVKKNASPVWDEGFQISVPMESGELDEVQGDARRPDVVVVVEILDSAVGVTEFGVGGTIIGRISLKDHDLRLPTTGPACKVIECPLDLASPPAVVAKRHGRAKILTEKKRSPTTTTVVLFLEKIPGSFNDDREIMPPSSVSFPSHSGTVEKTEITKSWASGAEEEGGMSRNEQHEMSKVQLKVLRARGLAKGVNCMDPVVAVRACGRDIGMTKVSAVGGTTSPEWIDEEFILRADACAELCLDVWGRKNGQQDSFLGRASMRFTADDIMELARIGELQDLPLHKKSAEILPLVEQTLVRGHLIFSLLPWREFNYPEELDRSNSCRGLQVQVCVLGATNLTSPSVSVLATFSFRGTEISRTGTVRPNFDCASSDVTNTRANVFADGNTKTFRPFSTKEVDMATVTTGSKAPSHTWTAAHRNTCVIPLPEECWERRGIEVEIDLWEAGGVGREKGDHLGQVTLSGDFVPHVVHGDVLSRPLRPPHSHGSRGNLPARGALHIQLWLRRGGESLASEFLDAPVTVEVLSARGLGPENDRCTAFCVVKGDGDEIGRTQSSTVEVPATTVLNVADEVRATARVSWENSLGTTQQFPIPLSAKNGGGLLVHVMVEVWLNEGIETVLRVDDGADETEKTARLQARLLGTVKVDADTLVSGPISPVSMPLAVPLSRSNTKTLSSSTARKTNGTTHAHTHAPQIVLRITPQIGPRWAHRVMASAGEAKRARSMTSAPPAAEELAPGDPASVLYMTNAERSARIWRTLVTPGDSIPRKAYKDIVELTCAAMPACCPNMPALAVAPISDVGAHVGGVRIGPPTAARHALIAFRPARRALDRNRCDVEEEGGEGEHPPAEDELLMRSAAAEAERLLREVRASEMRAEQRKLALVRVREICEQWQSKRSGQLADISLRKEDTVHYDDETGAVERRCQEGVETDAAESSGDEDDEDDDHTTSGRSFGGLFRAFLGALEVALPGVSVYIGILAGGGRIIHYIACTRGSSMTGKMLKLGEGVSFSCVGPRYLPSLIYPPRGCRLPLIHQRRSDGNVGSPRVTDGEHQGTMCPSFPRAVFARGPEQTVKGAVVSAADTVDTEGDRSTAAAAAPVERSPEQGVVAIQKSFRGKTSRERSARQTQGLLSNVGGGGKGQSILKKSKLTKLRTLGTSTTSSIPKVFDYDGRVGWPFVCVPLVGSLGSSSIGVIGMDTFEQMGGARSREQPQAVVVEAVAEAARVLGSVVHSDRRRRALDEVTRSCQNLQSSLFDVLHAAANALAGTIAASSGAEVWKIDPSDGSLFIVARGTAPRTTMSTHEVRRAQVNSPYRPLKLDVVSAELARPIADYEASPAGGGGAKIQSVSVRISAGNETVYRTSQFRVDPQYGGAATGSTTHQWHDGECRLRIDRGVTSLRGELLAKVAQSPESPDALGRAPSAAGTTEHVIATATVDLSTVRNGYNYITMFSPSRNDSVGVAGEGNGERTELDSVAPADGRDEAHVAVPRLLGQLILRLNWIEREGREDSKGGLDNVILVIHGASGLAKVGRASDPYCVVKWEGVELGRTRCCPSTCEPSWGQERFRLTLPNTPLDDTLSLVMEVWAEDARAAKSDFLGQVVLHTRQLESPAPGLRGLVLTSKPASELRPSAQKRVQGTLEFSLETPRAIAKAAADATTAATTRDGSMSPMNDLTHSATQGSLVPSGMATIANGAASAKGEPPQPFDAGAAAKLQAPHLDNATYELEERAGGGIDDHNAKEQDDEWDRMRWAADNHGGDAGSVGTVEVASKTTDKNGETGPAKAEPEDLLIRLKEVTGLVEAGKFGQIHPYLVIKVGPHELGRTRSLKFAERIVWERPEERFRLPLEKVRGERGSLHADETTAAATTATTANINSDALSVSALSGSHFTSASVAARNATTVATGDNHVPGTSTPNAHVPHVAYITIEVWAKTIVGKHREFLGSATIPAGEVEHPPGDIWLPVQGKVPVDSFVERNQSDDGEHEGGVAADLSPVLADSVEKKQRRKLSWGNGFFKAIRGGGDGKSKGSGLRQERKIEFTVPPTGLVHLWLGKIRRGGSAGREAGTGSVMLRIHAASGLRKADRLGNSDPKCFVVWNGDEIGATSTRYNTLNPSWDPAIEEYSLRLPQDRSLCELHIDVWDMDNVGTKRGDFLGRVSIPPAHLLHPPPGGSDAPMALPLLPLEAPEPAKTGLGAIGEGYDVTAQCGIDALEDDALAEHALLEVNDASTSPAKHAAHAHHLHGGLAGRFASRLIGNVQRHIAKDEAIAGKLTISFEFLDDDAAVAAGRTANKRLLQEPRPLREANGYATMKFKVAEDPDAAKRRRDREGIKMSRMLSRVEELQQKLQGAVVTGAAAAHLSEITGGAAAVIPEVLAGQVLSLAHRGGGHTVIAASGAGGTALDRLVVTLEPLGVDDDEAGKRAEERSRPHGDSDSSQRGRADDHRSRYALVVRCAPGQLSKGDVTVAGELARAADAAAVLVERRRRRRLLMEDCAEKVEKLCRERKHNHEGLCKDTVAALRPAREGAGDEVDCPRRDLACIVSLLSPGGYRLRVAASSDWKGDTPKRDTGSTGGSMCTAECTESVGRWSGALPLASGLVKRALEKGDVFLVIEGYVCVANASWRSILHETMPHKHASSDPALEKSVQILRTSLGPVATNAFLIAPLWVPGVGCLGLFTLADLPYARVAATGPLNKRRAGALRSRSRNQGKSGMSEFPYMIGAGVVNFAVRVGVALGVAVHRVRTEALLASINVEREIGRGDDRRSSTVKYSPRMGIKQHEPAERQVGVSKDSTAAAEQESAPLTRTTQVLLWPASLEEVCSIYSAALAAATEAIPWIRAADVWHISSLPEHENIFLPEQLPLREKSSSSEDYADDTTVASINSVTSADTNTRNSSKHRTEGDGGGGSGRNGECFDERVVGRTWAGSPVVVLRSLRTPGREEAARVARWIRMGGDSGWCGDEDWSDKRLRLLADEWELCAGGRGGKRSLRSRDMPPSTVRTNITEPARLGGESTAGQDTSKAASPTIARPFMVHTGHLIVPFSNGRVREDREVVGHGLMLAVDRGVDWSPWESHLAEIAAAATRRFEALERKSHTSEKLRVTSWVDTLLDHRGEVRAGVGLGDLDTGHSTAV